jgi:hypothetical protein
MRIKRLNEMNIEEEKTIFFFQRTVSDDLLIFKNGDLWKNNRDEDINIRKVILELCDENLSEYEISEIKLDGYYDENTLDEFYKRSYDVLSFVELEKTAEELNISLEYKKLT